MKRMLSALSDKRRRNYWFRSAWANFTTAMSCPFCGAADHSIVRRKMVVTALARCRSCQLLYRIPRDADANAETFYQEEYVSGMTAECPSAEQLRQLFETRFRGTEKDFTQKIAITKALGVKPGSRILDYGASWGYGVWQFNQAGFDAAGYELSKSRSRYARESLNVVMHDDVEKISAPLDVFFSSHVLEHLLAPQSVFQLARRLVKPGGLFIAFTPNGSEDRLRSDPKHYHRNWGAIHPLFFNDAFYSHIFKDRPHLIASNPYDISRIQSWNRSGAKTLDLTGSELLAAAVF
jgi:cyclopropane fatty-acyl-phospholipid synthase-like methyltransferase